MSARRKYGRRRCRARHGRRGLIRHGGGRSQRRRDRRPGRSRRGRRGRGHRNQRRWRGRSCRRGRQGRRGAGRRRRGCQRAVGLTWVDSDRGLPDASCLKGADFTKPARSPCLKREERTGKSLQVATLGLGRASGLHDWLHHSRGDRGEAGVFVCIIQSAQRRPIARHVYKEQGCNCLHRARTVRSHTHTVTARG